MFYYVFKSGLSMQRHHDLYSGAARHATHDLCRHRDSPPPAAIGHTATGHIPLQVVVLYLAVLHRVLLTLCGFDRQPVM